MVRTRVAQLASVLGVSAVLLGPVEAQDLSPDDPEEPVLAAIQPGNGVIASIRVEGNQRIEPGTILSYMLVQPGDPFDPDRLDRSLKTLYATGLFSDVNLRRDGSTLVVHVVENPLVNRVAFEGNHKLSDDQLKAVVQLRTRSVFTPAIAQSDRQKILATYAGRGRYAARVEPKIVKLSNNRVDVIFEITEGEAALVSRIAFVGNRAFGEDRLREVVDSREERWWRFLSSSDIYDPERVSFDKELLRRFYLRNGYVDFKVVNATAELAPDRSAFFLTFTLDEGERYRVAKVSLNVTLPHVDAAKLQQYVDIEAGDWYDGDAVERNVQVLTDAVQHQGIPFVDVRPRISRDPKKHTVELVFDVVEAPRVYVERIDISGNTRTQDRVIRREFRLAEGDAFNAALVRRSRQALEDLNYFGKVTVNQAPGSAADRTVINANIEEKSTGELTIGGGYSTDVGPLANVGLREKNLLGTGLDAGVNSIIAQLESQVTVSVTDPYFLDRNLLVGGDVYYVQNNLQNISEYNERRYGATLRAGYAFSEHLRQSWTYSAVSRDVYSIANTASPYISQMSGVTNISQLGQTITIDYRDSTLDPHSGWLVRAGTDVAGLGGSEDFVRTKLDAAYYIPLEGLTGSRDWGLAITGGVGYLVDFGGKGESIVDRFFLGGDNLRGFLDGGAGPHAIPQTVNGITYFADSIGGRFIYTQSTEVRFPLPISADLGLTGRTFVDLGGLAVVKRIPNAPITDYYGPRVATGFGVSWKSPFGLINIDLGVPVIKYHFDQQQLFRVGFGTRF